MQDFKNNCDIKRAVSTKINEKYLLIQRLRVNDL